MVCMETLNCSDRATTCTLPRDFSIAVIWRRRSLVSRINLPEPSAMSSLEATPLQLWFYIYQFGVNFNLMTVRNTEGRGCKRNKNVLPHLHERKRSK